MILKPVAAGIFGTLGLLALYFGVVNAVSGWDFALAQFRSFWYFVVALAVGFGIQIGLYTYLRGLIRVRSAVKGVVAVSGTTSAVAMVSCCAHYAVNIVPIRGAVGLISVIGQYQVELFWVGLAANGAGILYIARGIIRFAKS